MEAHDPIRPEAEFELVPPHVPDDLLGWMLFSERRDLAEGRYDRVLAVMRRKKRWAAISGFSMSFVWAGQALFFLLILGRTSGSDDLFGRWNPGLSIGIGVVAILMAAVYAALTGHNQGRMGLVIDELERYAADRRP